MKAITIAFALLLTLTLVKANLAFNSFNGDFNSITAANGAIALSDLINVANYYGCKTWVKNQCTECSQGFHFSEKGVCCQIPQLCSQFNLAQGVCVACYQGYSVVNSTCKLAALDTGCAVWNGNICSKCSQRWYFNNGVCNPVSDQCYTWDSHTGKCLSCYNGYVLTNGVCSVHTNLATGFKDPLCAKWVGGACSQCASRAYFNVFGVCTLVSDQCQTWDPKSGVCISCYGGYVLSNGACNQAAVQALSDLACALWNANNNICLQCSNRYYYNGKQCVPVNDQCNTWDSSSGRCTTCYNGYDLQLDGTCQLSTKNSAPSDLGCGTWDWKNLKCLQCSNNWVFNSNGVCVPVSDQCNTFDSRGNCVSCYVGYNLQNGKCFLAPTQAPSDLGCGNWDWKNQKCLQCSNNWVFNDKGVCIPVSDQCNTFDSRGNCVTCYKGYNLVSGKCVLAPLQNVADAGCGVWDWENQVCKQCSARWVFNNQNKCVPINDNCQQWDNNGACTSCYAGYVLQGGKCTQGNSLCQSSNSNGACTSCYSGYILDNGSCVPISKLANLALYYSLCCPERLATLTNSVGGSSDGHVAFHA